MSQASAARDGRPNVLLVAAAVLYGAAALPLIFASDELLAAAGLPPQPLISGLAQVLGGSLFGLAMLNWFQRHTLTGGIYGRPVVVANFSHAMIGAFALAHVARDLQRSGAVPVPLLVAAGAYAVLAIAFGRAFFGRGPA